MYPANPETLPIVHEDQDHERTISHAQVTAAIAQYRAKGNRIQKLPPERMSNFKKGWYQRQAKREQVASRRALNGIDEGRTFNRGETADQDQVERGFHTHGPQYTHCALCEAREKARANASKVY